MLRPIPDDILPWALEVLGDAAVSDSPALSAVAGDASNRRYFRLSHAGGSAIVVEAPPSTEKNNEFLSVGGLLASEGIRAPAIYGADLARGYLLLEDLGDRLLLPELNDVTVGGHYDRAFDLLQKMALMNCTEAGLPRYDRALLEEELSRFPSWFVQGLLGLPPDRAAEELFQNLSSALVGSALEQPRVFVHRDFHSRNIMLQPDGELAVIDFQDAVIGPVTYDPVSLLRDCYLRWSPSRVVAWALEYKGRLEQSGVIAEMRDDEFMRWFDWMGLQRHIKVLGTFARLHLRDGKPGYLEDLPRVIGYVREILDKYASEDRAFASFSSWFHSELDPLIARQDWGGKS